MAERKKKKEKSGDDKKGTVDRQRQMSLFGISTKLQREGLAWSHRWVWDKWSESVCELLCQPGPSLFPYSTLSSPAATGNQTISRREIKGPISPSGSCKHGNSVWNMLPSSCKVVFPAVSCNTIKQHFLTKKKTIIWLKLKGVFWPVYSLLE